MSFQEALFTKELDLRVIKGISDVVASGGGEGNKENQDTNAVPPAGSKVTSAVQANNTFASPKTPTFGGKRKLPIPPSPEQSPEGPYIGQHSQGIGGHYADSYWRKRAKYN